MVLLVFSVRVLSAKVQSILSHKSNLSQRNKFDIFLIDVLDNMIESLITLICDLLTCV